MLFNVGWESSLCNYVPAPVHYAGTSVPVQPSLQLMGYQLWWPFFKRWPPVLYTGILVVSSWWGSIVVVGKVHSVFKSQPVGLRFINHKPLALLRCVGHFLSDSRNKVVDDHFHVGWTVVFIVVFDACVHLCCKKIRNLSEWIRGVRLWDG